MYYYTHSFVLLFDNSVLLCNVVLMYCIEVVFLLFFFLIMVCMCMYVLASDIMSTVTLQLVYILLSLF